MAKITTVNIPPRTIPQSQFPLQEARGGGGIAVSNKKVKKMGGKKGGSKKVRGAKATTPVT